MEAAAHSYDPQIIVTSASGRGWRRGLFPTLQGLRHCTESCFTWWLQNVDNTWMIREPEWSAKVDSKIYVLEMRIGMQHPS